MSTAPLYARSTPDTDRGLSSAIWRGFNRDDDNPLAITWVIRDDFTVPRANATDASANNNWFIQDAAAGGTVENFTTIASPDGVATLSATTGTDHFGIEAHYGESATTAGVIRLPSATTDPRGAVAFETRVNLTNLKQFFIGLTEPIVEFLGATSGLPANSDYIGFHRDDGGALVLSVANDNNGGTAVTDTYTIKTAAEMDALEDATSNWAVLGLRVNADDSVEVAFNGEWFSSSKININPLALPIEALTIKYGIYRGATDDQATVALPIDTCFCAIINTQPTT